LEYFRVWEENVGISLVGDCDARRDVRREEKRREEKRRGEREVIIIDAM
jgi:hypothetical protein